jgi:hypothetical protein
MYVFSVLFLSLFMVLSGSRSLVAMDRTFADRNTDLQIASYITFADACATVYETTEFRHISHISCLRDDEDKKCLIENLVMERYRLCSLKINPNCFGEYIQYDFQEIPKEQKYKYRINNPSFVDLHAKQLNTLHSFNVMGPLWDAVTVLNISENGLHILPLRLIASSCRNLSVLDCSNNSIKTIIEDHPHLSHNSTLSCINLDNNKVSTKEVLCTLLHKNFMALQDISVRGNPTFSNKELVAAENVIKARLSNRAHFPWLCVKREKDAETITTTYSVSSSPVMQCFLKIVTNNDDK